MDEIEDPLDSQSAMAGASPPGHPGEGGLAGAQDLASVGVHDAPGVVSAAETTPGASCTPTDARSCAPARPPSPGWPGGWPSPMAD